MHRRNMIAHALPLLMLIAPPAMAATFTVTRADDPLTVQCIEGDCSLRGAVAAAAVTPEADLVLMPAGVFTLARSPLTVAGGVTIRGAGSTATSIVGSSGDVAITGGVLSELVIEGLRFATPAEQAISVTDGRLVLRDVELPGVDNRIVVSEQSLTASLAIDASRLPAAICIGNTVACTVTDSAIATMGVIGNAATLDARRIASTGSGTSTGVYVESSGRVRIADATFTGHATPLYVIASDADIVVERTRFFANAGPMRGEGGGMARLEDVEFSDNVVSDANLTRPSVLLATDGVAWRVNRALFDGNRGGGGGAVPGATVAVGVGANVNMTNVTFVDNTYRSGVASTPAHAIGVLSTAANPTILWLFHATMRRPSTVAASTLGTLVSVSGGGASVRLFNSVLDGTCLFGNGGSVFQAVATIESIGSTCGIAGSGNFVNVPAGQLGLGALADNGGFTWSSMPTAASYVVGRADPTYCRFAFGLDQRRHVRPADAVGCDVGAIERGAVEDTLFADDFD